jgi:dienelactone hydrolase
MQHTTRLTRLERNLLWILLATVNWSAAARAAESPIAVGEQPPEVQTRGQRAIRTGMYRAQVTPHWFRDGTKFWYRNELQGGTSEFIVVHTETGMRQPAFDHDKLAAALSKAAEQQYVGNKLPFESIEFVDQERAIQFGAVGKTWKCDLESFECVSLGDDKREPRQPQRPPGPVGQGPRGGGRRGDGESRGPIPSPSGAWSALVRDHNVFVRSGEEEIQLSHDGESKNSYGRLEWSPDSKTLVAWRIEPGERKEVHLIQSSPAGGGRAVLHARPYDLPGDKFASFELNLFDIDSRLQTKPQVDRVDFGTPRLRWDSTAEHFAYQKVDRGHQRFRVIEVNARSGSSRNVIDERSDTFIWTAHTENLRLSIVNWMSNSNEMIYVSERDGWRHLYLVDVRAGSSSPITQGQYVVRGIDKIDEDARQVWFHASGRNPDQDPYLVHYYRVNFDGTGLVPLTEGNGNHAIQYSPDRRFIIDTYSRVDEPPVHELRRVCESSCELVSRFDEADISELKSSGWQAPEVFVAKARDGVTDIWGIICRPAQFNPGQKYPVIEDIYAGPQSSFVPKTFSSARRYAALNDLGFVVAKIDGMGTANRSKAFHDVCWKNLKDAGLPDRIAWHRAVAARYPWYDISRVGIYGGSAGGQNAAGALLFHPDFYKAAVASCGCHDNRMDKASWNEQWMGYPVGPQYSESSNIDNAHRLRGKLLLIVGEMDTNVPPESTMRLVDALIKANKDFDLLVVPGGGHGMGGAYGQRRLQDFFVRHLLGVEGPNRNAETTAGD